MTSAEGQTTTTTATMGEPANNAPETRRTLRNFGLLVGGLLLLWAMVRFWRHRALWLPAGSVGGALLLLGLLLPQVLRWPYRGWMALGEVLGGFSTRLILLTIYWLLIVPIGVVRRMLFGSPFGKPASGADKSYWQPRAPDSRGSKHYENLF